MRTTITAIFSTFLISLSIGCESTQSTSLDKSLKEYQSDQFFMSEMWAQKSIDQNQSVDEAQYMLGLCEFKLGHLESSKAWFNKSSTSSNPDVRGKSNAMIGIILDSNGDYEKAKVRFTRAALDLIGTDKEKVKARLDTSSSFNTQEGQFSLQYGAFRKSENAIKAVKELSDSTNNLGLGKPWIDEEQDRMGKTIYLVKVGHFSSRNKATTQKQNPILSQCIVTVTP
ncbi:MAG: SPOR domain-containing protein [Phycisphaerales bacterium]|jgi:tetratricopeptide (TPR) repeat protein|nr:SPOR domain-containing protein [Phycisphaerales bacterium]